MAISLRLRRSFPARGPAFAGPGLAASLLVGLVLGPSSALAQAPAPAQPPAEAAPQPPEPPQGSPAAPAPAPAPASAAAPAPASAAAPASAPAAVPAPAPASAPAEEAPPAPDAEPAWQSEPRTRRFGFTVGLAGGLLLGTVAGFPNDAKKIGRQRYYTETGVGIGGGTLWIGGALSDWLTFGFGVGGAGLAAGDYGTSRWAFIFHTEVFPAFALGGMWREIGVSLDTGVGSSVTTAADGDTKAIDGGAASRLGGGVFYEGLRFGKISTGPWLYADYTWSASVRQGGVYLGWRTALYSKP